MSRNHKTKLHGKHRADQKVSTDRTRKGNPRKTSQDILTVSMFLSLNMLNVKVQIIRSNISPNFLAFRFEKVSRYQFMAPRIIKKFCWVIGPDI